ncbi:cellulose binding domain-containing protein [Phytomonospora sp. NPDC050363]|uniref:cellulose binding domain-containing protein n=1 Tax=Phytomonospora sp. NPDC050363 TaxID=3155642 RepID=UPI0033CC94FD
MRHHRLPLTAAAALALATASLLAAPNPPDAAAADGAVSVTVNANAGLATMPETGLGVNHAIWDAELASDETADLLADAGVRMVRYPGGSYADIYHWETHTAPGGYVAPGTDFDAFMAAAERTGAEPMIIANYGTASAGEAAEWVRYANVTKGYGARYWTVGNENYGNGHYGSAWEADERPRKDPAYYAAEVVAYAEAMKAVDPSIKVGAVLTTPGNWPDGIVTAGDAGTWNQVVLSIAGPSIDFVDVHWYPGGSSAAESLTRTEHIGDAVRMLREQIVRHGGAGASRIGISMTELNVGVGPNTQPGALFLADAYSELLAEGVFTVNWWNVHNGIGTVSTVAGQTDYGDFGLLSSGTCTADGSVCEPAFNTPFAPYFGLSMMDRFARPGDRFVAAGTSDPLVAAHAVRRPDGNLALLLLNKDPDNARDITVDYAGFAPASTPPTVHTYTNGATSITESASGGATSRTLPPYSLTTLVLRPAQPAVGAPGAPGQPVAAQVTDTSARISWPAGSAGAAPVAKYELYRQNGPVGEQLGETGGTSITVGNLVPGTRYTVNVLTRDTAGRVSWASPPLTFTTGTPASSTCSVRFGTDTDWGNGYVASVDITNTGPVALDGWTLTFAWPTAWQQMNGGWNADWTQTGRSVKVTPLDHNRSLAAGGGTTNVGFVGGYSGPNVRPTVFTLNGTVCRTV